ncbi:MAG: hypothetical protein QXE90_04050 [Candidatus Micrarchaeia archaeon]
MKNMEKNCEDIRPKNMEKENRIWKAAKLGILGLSFMVFGNKIKAEEPKDFAKDHYENGTVIEYNYNIDDQNKSKNENYSYYNDKYEFSSKDTAFSIYTKNKIGIGRMAMQLEIERDNINGRSSDSYNDKFGDSMISNEKEKGEETKIFLGLTTEMASDGVNGRIRIGGGYYREEKETTYNKNDEILIKGVTEVLYIDENGNEMTIEGDQSTNRMLNENKNGSFNGNKFYVQYLINSGKLKATPIIWIANTKGELSHSLEDTIENKIMGDVCYLGSCQPGAIYWGFDTNVRNKIQVKKNEIGIKIPVSIENNLIAGEFSRTIKEYNNTDYSFDSGLEKEIINKIAIYYKRKIISSIAAKIGYVHTLEKIIRLHEEEKRQNSKLIVGAEVKF